MLAERSGRTIPSRPTKAPPGDPGPGSAQELCAHTGLCVPPPGALGKCLCSSPPPVPGAPKKGIDCRRPPAFPRRDLHVWPYLRCQSPRICTRPVSLLPARRPCRHVVLDPGALHRPPQEANAIRLQLPSCLGRGTEGQAWSCEGLYVRVRACARVHACACMCMHVLG